MAERCGCKEGQVKSDADILRGLFYETLASKAKPECLADVSTEIDVAMEDFAPLVRGGLGVHRAAGVRMSLEPVYPDSYDEGFLDEVDVGFDYDEESEQAILVIKYTMYFRIMLPGRFMESGEDEEVTIEMPVEYRIPHSKWSHYGPYKFKLQVSPMDESD